MLQEAPRIIATVSVFYCRMSHSECGVYHVSHRGQGRSYQENKTSQHYSKATLTYSSLLFKLVLSDQFCPCLCKVPDQNKSSHA